MSESEFPGAPTWLQSFYTRMERRDSDMLEKFLLQVKETVQDELKPVLVELNLAISQARGYGKVVGEGTAKIERLEDRVAETEKQLHSIHGPRPPVKASSNPATPTTPSGRPKLIALPGAVDHPSTIPAPPDDEGENGNA